MSVPDPPPLTNRELEAIESQAHAWVRRLTSGFARKSDAEALKQWCAAHPEHARAFREAHRRWRELMPAAKRAAQGDVELAALRAARPVEGARTLPRRAFLGSALAVSAAAAGMTVFAAPWRPWSSMQSLRADYLTAIGERRKLTLTQDVTIEMNTRSSIALRTIDGAMVGIELIEGEAAVDALRTMQPFTVVAGTAHTEARGARFQVRRLEDTCVTCLEGVVRVAHPAGDRTLHSAQQVRYDDRIVYDVLGVDPEAASIWRDGILSFHDTALAEVVAEINRYRPGRVILFGKHLGARPVSGRFHIDDLDKAIVQIQRVFKLEANSLPGGIVVLS